MVNDDEREHASSAATSALMERQNAPQQQDPELPLDRSLLQREVYFKAEEVIAWSAKQYSGFFPFPLLKNLLVKDKNRKELVFTDSVMWTDDSYTGDKLIFSEACRDDRNS